MMGYSNNSSFQGISRSFKTKSLYTNITSTYIHITYTSLSIHYVQNQQNRFILNYLPIQNNIFSVTVANSLLKLHIWQINNLPSLVEYQATYTGTDKHMPLHSHYCQVILFTGFHCHIHTIQKDADMHLYPATLTSPAH